MCYSRNACQQQALLETKKKHSEGIWGGECLS